MVALEKKNYLQKAHFSSGRLPSPKGYRFFINNVMKEKELSTVDEVAYKHSIWDEREKGYRMLSQASRVLAQRTGLLSLVATNSGELYYAGTYHLLEDEDMFDNLISKQIFERLDEVNFWEEILRQTHVRQEELYFILGTDDFRDPIFDSCSSIFGDFEAEGIRGIIGVVGPKYLKFELIAPQIRFFSHLIEDMIKEQKQLLH